MLNRTFEAISSRSVFSSVEKEYKKPSIEAAVAGTWHLAWIPVSVAVSYYVGTKIGFALTPHQWPISTFWPPNALLLAAFLLVPMRMWWLLLLGVLPAHLLVQSQAGVPLSTAAGWFIGNSGEALLGAICINWFKKSHSLFGSVHGVIVFLIFGGFVAPLVTSFIDAAVVVTTGWGRDYWMLWTTRLFSNMLATITLVPTIVMAVVNGASWVRKANPSRCLEGGLLAVGIIGMSILVFGHPAESRNSVPAEMYMPLPLLLWSALRFGTGGVSTSLCVVALVSIWNATHSRGPFTSGSTAEITLALQVFLCTITLPLMLLAADVAERQEVEQSLRDTSVKLIDSQERERRRIARELHDDIGQQLTLVGLELGKLGAECDSEIKTRLDKLSDRVGEISTTTHELSVALHPSYLEHLGLAHALSRLCQELDQSRSLSVNVIQEGVPDRLPSDISLCLYRVAQEALQNVAKHSHARTVTVRLSANRGRLLLVVADDGRGFDCHQEQTSGLGLTSMRERVRSVGGKIEIVSASMHGTNIEVEIPLNEPPALTFLGDPS
jgi:two-component system sensor histidine kinase UhpB